jgi:hypothetical protein
MIFGQPFRESQKNLACLRNFLGARRLGFFCGHTWNNLSNNFKLNSGSYSQREE